MKINHHSGVGGSQGATTGGAVGRSAARDGGATLLVLAVALGVVLAGALFLGYAAREAGAQAAINGKVLAWGSSSYGQTSVPATAGSGVEAIAAGENHSLALKGDGSVLAWGRNDSGQVNVPTAAASGVKAVAGGHFHSLALKDGSVIAWGLNTTGQTSVPETAKSGVEAIAAGRTHSLALKEDGSVVAWGAQFNGLGQYGQANVPEAAGSGVVAIAAGQEHNLALKGDGSVVAWGRDDSGQSTVPDAAKGGVKAVAGGYFHSLALKEDGSVVAWGGTGYGETDVPDAAKSGVVAIAAGKEYSLALKEDGSVITWGSPIINGQGYVPDSVKSGVVAIAAGRTHALALNEDKTPPAAVGSFSATAAPTGGRVNLSWTNPPDADFESVRILRSSNGFYTSNPQPDADQTLVYEGPAESFTDTGLTNGTSYKYSAFAHDGRNFSGWATTEATPYDATPPDTVLDDGGPSGVVASTSALFGFTSTEAGSTFECSLDGAAFESCTSGKAYGNLDDGPHTVEVRAVDAARNNDPTPARRAWTVDTGPPDTAINSGPSGVTNGLTAAFGISSTERGSTLECRLDDAPFGPCDPQKTYESLGDGFHVFEARAVDAAGTTDPTPARRTWSVDTAAPNTGITEGPSGTVRSATADFEFLASEPGATFRCSLDGAAFAACDSPERLTGLSDGPHTFRVQATDAAGNVDATPASRTWAVDAAVPGGPEITSPANNSSDTDGAFVVEGTAEGSNTVRLYDGAARVGMAEADPESGAWQVPLSGVPDGRHTYTATATDAAGNTSAASAGVTVLVDSAAPSVVRVDPRSGARGVAAMANVTVTFSEAMSPATVSKATVKLFSGGRVVPAKVTYSVEAKTATLNPGARLMAGTTYRAVVSTGAEDAAGNPLPAAEGWRFSVKP